MSKAIFYHAGCQVCVQAEQKVAEAIGRSRYSVEIVHLGEAKNRLIEAEQAGVKSVPALALDKEVEMGLDARRRDQAARRRP